MTQSSSLGTQSCVFCDIAAGRLPSAKLYEDDRCLVILDILPIYHGHALVLPKAHCRDLLDAPAEVLEPLMRAAQRCAPAIVKATDSEGFLLIQANGREAGQTVFHLHIHIIPRKRGDGFAERPLRDLERFKMEERFDDLTALAASIRNSMEAVLP